MTRVEPFEPLTNVAVIAGGLSHERDVSLRSGRRLVRDLAHAGTAAHMYDADHSLLRRLREDEIAVALPILHGDIGEDGALQTVLELAGVPFVGSSSGACRVAWDKATARAVLEPSGIRMPRWVALPSSSFRELGSADIVDALLKQIELPLVVKPNRGGSVLGISGVVDAHQLPAALMQCFAYGSTAVIERFVEGVDVSVAVIDVDGVPTALEPVALHYDREHQFDFAARYDPGLIQVEAPAQLAADVRQELKDVAVRAHRLLGLRDLSRSDFLVDRGGAHVLLETAIAPGMTETSLFPFSVQAAGRNFGECLTGLLAAAIRRGP